jgi:DNA-binding response OmpR family regulator
MGINELKRPRLLITEDDFENRRFLELFLKRHFIVDMCDSSETFYALISKNNYDIILMDISIKGDKNGLELIKEMKSNPELKTIPIVCYTAHAFNKDRLNALDAGADAYISKPTDIKILLGSLIDLLKDKGFEFQDKTKSSSNLTHN